MSLEHLVVLNLTPGAICKNLPPQSIVINTCQRTIVASFNSHLKNDPNQEIYFGTSAYKFLLEVICGLKSKIIAENEIVSQFKNAYHLYLNQSNEFKNGNLIKILEKIFKDSKEIRTKYLMGITHESYAGITKKVLKSNIHKNDEKPKITILGSGKLAEDIIKNCSRSYCISVVARNKNRTNQLKETYQVFTYDINSLKNLPSSSYIINTIGSKEKLLTDLSFFNEWKSKNSNRFFLDLGSPSTIETSLTLSDSVMVLSNFFKYAEIIGNEKKQKIELAKIAIDGLAKKRNLIFNLEWTNYHHGPLTL